MPHRIIAITGGWDPRPLVVELEATFDLKPGFYDQLLNSDDWTFVLQLNAFLESGVLSLLQAHFNDTRLESFLATIPMNSGRVSRVSAIRALGLLDPYTQLVMDWVGRARNRAAHSIRGVNFTFDSFIQSLAPNQKNEFRTTFQLEGIDPLAEPKLMVWAAGLYTLTNIRVALQKIDNERDVEKIAAMELEAANIKAALYDKLSNKKVD